MTTSIFPARYESLEKISQFVRKAAQEAHLDPNAIYSVELSVDEACTNIIEHGYGGEGIGDIECTCEVIPEGLRIMLIDQARPFDITRVPDPKVKVPLKELKPRGLGVFFMYKMMDEVRYETTRAGNILTMLKRNHLA